MCIVCFFLGYFVADVVSKCGFGREHLTSGTREQEGYARYIPQGDQADAAWWNHPGSEHLTSADDKNDLMLRDAGNTNQGRGNCPFQNGIGCEWR